VARTVDCGHGVRIDFDAHGAAMGVEITAPLALTVVEVNAILVKHGIAGLDAEEWAPLAA